MASLQHTLAFSLIAFIIEVRPVSTSRGMKAGLLSSRTHVSASDLSSVDKNSAKRASDFRLSSSSDSWAPEAAGLHGHHAI